MDHQCSFAILTEQSASVVLNLGIVEPYTMYQVLRRSLVTSSGLSSIASVLAKEGDRIDARFSSTLFDCPLTSAVVHDKLRKFYVSQSSWYSVHMSLYTCQHELGFLHVLDSSILECFCSAPALPHQLLRAAWVWDIYRIVVAR